MTSDTQHAESGSIDRRTFIKGIGVTGAAGIGMSGQGPTSAVGGAQALPPFVVAGAAAAVGWALYETDPLGSNPPPEGTTESVLRLNSVETARSRYSNDRSTFLDNENIIDGIEHTAYTEGKIAAIEALNQEVSQDEVQDAATEAAREQVATVQKNLLKSFNETMREVYAIWERGQSHPDISGKDDLVDYNYAGSSSERGIDGPPSPTDVDLVNGETFETEQVTYRYYQSASNEVRGATRDISSESDLLETFEFYVQGDNGDERMLDWHRFAEFYQDFFDIADDISDGLILWVDSVYGEVQSGEIDVADLLTPREQAELLSDDEEYPQAVADLVALNIPVDPDREATISFDDRDITITGLMAPTSPPENGFQTGQSYDPAAEEWDLYFTYDPALGSGGWNEVEPTISQGELVFTAEPYEGTIYRVPTNQGTVEVVSDEFDAEGDTWVADVSGQLDRTAEEWTDFETGIDGGTVTFGSLPNEPTDFEIVTNQGDTEVVAASSFEEINGSYEADTDLGIAEIAEVTAEIDRAYVDEDDSTSVYAEDGETGYETIQVSDPFTIESIENSDGEEVGETEFSRTEPQTDENYITQEEWDELQEQNQELIERYEDATTNDGLFGGGWDPFEDGIPEIPGGAAAAAGVAVVVVGFGVLRQIASLYLPGR